MKGRKKTKKMTITGELRCQREDLSFFQHRSTVIPRLARKCKTISVTFCSQKKIATFRQLHR
ncbi:MAG TPA: hypothetical protein DCE42_23900 [Myxococcales bacterium]|nr:hypothetical protein [Deltaproteobacteria bacterium]HAA57831.1 hypothetical protein [Myxococcales bacterium]